MILGCVTIGQAPRVDVVPDIEPLLTGVHIIERGALDDVGVEEIAALAPAPGHPALVSRLRDGGSAVLDEERMVPLVQDAVDAVVADGADAVLVLCTGHLPSLQAPVPVYTAERLARGAASTLVGDDALGVLAPTPRQVDDIAARWRDDLGRRVDVVAVDPYTAADGEFTAAGRALGERSCRWIFLDCIGYSERMAALVREASGARVLTARGLAARMAAAATGA